MTGLWSVKIYIDGIYRVNYEFSLEGVNGPGTSTTTTSNSSGPCALSLIYGEHSADTELLRSIRDNVLSKTREGRELITLYYQWSPVIVRAMEEDEDLKQEIKAMIDALFPIIEEGME